jgi:hypothetical protein
MKIWVAICSSIFLLALTSSGGKHHGKPSPSPSPTVSPTPTPIPSPSPIPTPSPTVTPTPIPSVTLAWDAPNDPSIVGYHLWLGFTSRTETLNSDVGNVLTTTIQLSSGTTYFFYVTSYNKSGDSLPSNEVNYTTPP